MNDNPAFGVGLQLFMGIPSFMRLPVSRDLKDKDVAIGITAILASNLVFEYHSLLAIKKSGKK
jgi:hypothetical protein